MLTWVSWSSCLCTLGCAFVQAHSLPSCTYMGSVAGHMHTRWPHQVQRLRWTQRLEGSISCVDAVTRLHDAVCVVEEFSSVLVCLTRVCAHASEGHCIAEQLHTNRTQHNDVLKSILRFPWESGSFRGGQAPTGPRTQVGTAVAEAGSLCCAWWTCFSQEHLPCGRIPTGQAGQAGQEALVLPWRCTLPTWRGLEEVIPSVGLDSSVESGRPYNHLTCHLLSSSECSRGWVSLSYW